MRNRGHPVLKTPVVKEKKEIESTDLGQQHSESGDGGEHLCFYRTWPEQRGKVSDPFPNSQPHSERNEKLDGCLGWLHPMLSFSSIRVNPRRQREDALTSVFPASRIELGN